MASLSVYFSVLLLGHFIKDQGYKGTWNTQLGVPALSPPFADLRGLLAGAKSLTEGYNPILTNPNDPYGRPADYPLIWYPIILSFGLLRFNPNVIGLALGLSFFVSVLLYMGRVRILDGLLWGFLLCTPAPMVGVERGNCDLVIFDLLALALIMHRQANDYAKVGCYSLIEFCAFLKFFPVGAFCLALREKLRTTVTVALIGGLLFVGYMYLIRDQVKAISLSIPQLTFCSFGKNVFAHKYYPDHIPPELHIITSLTVIIICIFALLGRFWAPRIPQMSQAKINGLIVGSVLYIGSYTLNDSYNYRMMFLFFALPVLLHMAKIEGFYCGFSRVLLVALAAGWFFCSQMGWLLFPLKELANWIVFAGMTFLWLQCLPDSLTSWRKPEVASA